MSFAARRAVLSLTLPSLHSARFTAHDMIGGFLASGFVINRDVLDKVFIMHEFHPCHFLFGIAKWRMSWVAFACVQAPAVTFLLTFLPNQYMFTGDRFLAGLSFLGSQHGMTTDYLAPTTTIFAVYLGPEAQLRAVLV